MPCGNHMRPHEQPSLNVLADLQSLGWAGQSWNDDGYLVLMFYVVQMLLVNGECPASYVVQYLARTHS